VASASLDCSCKSYELDFLHSLTSSLLSFFTNVSLDKISSPISYGEWEVKVTDSILVGS
jgi:hypothetical protein